MLYMNKEKYYLIYINAQLLEYSIKTNSYKAHLNIL